MLVLMLVAMFNVLINVNFHRYLEIQSLKCAGLIIFCADMFTFLRTLS